MVIEGTFQDAKEQVVRLTVDEAFHRYKDRVFSAAFSVCQNRADADDVVQSTFLKYYTLDLTYESEEHLKAWLIRVTINCARTIWLSAWRRRSAVPYVPGRKEITFRSPSEKLEIGM